MVLVDTSVWFAHPREGDIGLEGMPDDGHVVCHPFIVGELACGNIRNRAEILSLLQALPMTISAEHDEVMHFIESHSLMGRGLGLIDVHLLASSILSEVPLWTLDRRLNQTARSLGLAY